MKKKWIKAIVARLPPELILELRAASSKAKTIIDNDVFELPGVKAIRAEVSRSQNDGTTAFRIAVHTKTTLRKAKIVSDDELKQHLYHLRPKQLDLESVDMLKCLDPEWLKKIDVVHIRNVTWQTFEELRDKTHFSGLALSCLEDGMDLDMLIEQMPSITNFSVSKYGKSDEIYKFANDEVYRWEIEESDIYYHEDFDNETNPNEGFRVSSRTLEMLLEKSFHSTGIKELVIRNERDGAFSLESLIHFLKNVKLHPARPPGSAVKIDIQCVRCEVEKFYEEFEGMLFELDWSLRQHRIELKGETFVVKTITTFFILQVFCFVQ